MWMMAHIESKPGTYCTLCKQLDRLHILSSRQLSCWDPIPGSSSPLRMSLSAFLAYTRGLPDAFEPSLPYLITSFAEQNISPPLLNTMCLRKLLSKPGCFNHSKQFSTTGFWKWNWRLWTWQQVSLYKKRLFCSPVLCQYQYMWAVCTLRTIVPAFVLARRFTLLFYFLKILFGWVFLCESMCFCVPMYVWKPKDTIWFFRDGAMGI